MHPDLQTYRPTDLQTYRPTDLLEILIFVIRIFVFLIVREVGMQTLLHLLTFIHSRSNYSQCLHTVFHLYNRFLIHNFLKIANILKHLPLQV